MAQDRFVRQCDTTQHTGRRFRTPGELNPLQGAITLNDVPPPPPATFDRPGLSRNLLHHPRRQPFCRGVCLLRVGDGHTRYLMNKDEETAAVDSLKCLTQIGRLEKRTWSRHSEQQGNKSGFSGCLGGLVKHHQPMPIAIYENVGAKVAATANFARFLAPTRFLDAIVSRRVVVTTAWPS